MLGRNGLHHFADRPAWPKAALFGRGSGEKLADEQVTYVGTAVFGAKSAGLCKPLPEGFRIDFAVAAGARNAVYLFKQVMRSRGQGCTLLRVINMPARGILTVVAALVSKGDCLDKDGRRLCQFSFEIGNAMLTVVERRDEQKFELRHLLARDTGPVV
jgi:hypothetical protein